MIAREHPARAGLLTPSVGNVPPALSKPPVTKTKKNQGAGEVALVFWWLMGIVVVVAPGRPADTSWIPGQLIAKLSRVGGGTRWLPKS